MHTCPYCGRVFIKRKQHQQHVADREKTGTCRKTIEDAKEERIKRMAATNGKKLKRKHKRWEHVTYDDIRDWT